MLDYKPFLLCFVRIITILLLLTSLLLIFIKVVQKRPAYPPRPWIINVPKNKALPYRTEHHFLFAKNEKGRIIVFDKNIQNGFEKKEVEYASFLKGESQPKIELSVDEKTLALVTENSLLLKNRITHEEILLEKTQSANRQNRYSRVFVNKIKWSFDDKYLLLEYIGFESNAFSVFDINKKEKFFPKGDGALSGEHIVWSPRADMFLDSSDTTVYGVVPGLYLSEPNNLKQFKNMASSLNLANYLFYNAVFSPDGKKIAFLCSAGDIAVKEPTPLDQYKKLMVYDLENKAVNLLDSSVSGSNLFFSPSGSVLFYSKTEEGKSRFYSFNLREQKSKLEFEIALETSEITNIKWMNENELVFEITEKNENYLFMDMLILVLDLHKQELVYSSEKFPYPVKILSINNLINLKDKPYEINDSLSQ